MATGLLVVPFRGQKVFFLLSPRVFNLNRSTAELFMTEDNVLSVLELVSLRCEKKVQIRGSCQYFRLEPPVLFYEESPRVSDRGNIFKL